MGRRVQGPCNLRCARLAKGIDVPALALHGGRHGTSRLPGCQARRAPRGAGVQEGEQTMKIVEVEGIGPAYAEKLTAAGVSNTDQLLAQGAKPKGREELAAATGISSKLILEWVNHVDLMRLKGVGPEYADLLEAAGVDSPAELAHRNATNLANTCQELNAARPTVRRVPTEGEIAGWIAEAKTLPKVVEH
jgi:predicted flap endonuclease-1-like 5' DNA nuclease